MWVGSIPGRSSPFNAARCIRSGRLIEYVVRKVVARGPWAGIFTTAVRLSSGLGLLSRNILPRGLAPLLSFPLILAVYVRFDAVRARLLAIAFRAQLIALVARTTDPLPYARKCSSAVGCGRCFHVAIPRHVEALACLDSLTWLGHCNLIRSLKRPRRGRYLEGSRSSSGV